MIIIFIIIIIILLSINSIIYIKNLKNPPKIKKYNCKNNICVQDDNGLYNNNTCNNDCIENKCKKDCNNNGVCNKGVCECSDDWYGDDCSFTCDSTNCINGTCDDQGKCKCKVGFEGETCQINKKDICSQKNLDFSNVDNDCCVPSKVKIGVCKDLKRNIKHPNWKCIKSTNYNCCSKKIIDNGDPFGYVEVCE